MSTSLLETLTRRQLLLFSLLMMAIVTTFFVLGGTKGADPATASIHIANFFNGKKKDDWYWYKASWSQDRNKEHGWVDKSMYELFQSGSMNLADDLVLATKFPHPGMRMSPYYQFMLVVMNVQVEFRLSSPDPIFNIDKDCRIVFSARLAYSDGDENKPEAMNWKLLSKIENENRPLSCKFMQFSRPSSDSKVDGVFSCEDQFMFELGSVSHKYYLLNMRFPNSTDNNGCLTGENDHFSGVHFAEIHQNGGYTVSLFVSKTILFPLVVCALIFFVMRVRRERREFLLAEKSLLALGCSLAFLVLPVDWLTLVADMPYMLLFSDIRQGIFYACLLQFWCIFAGEHILDQKDRNQIGAYKYELGFIILGCLSLAIFDMVERGMQLTNPFHTIWRRDAGEKAARAFLIIAGVAAVLFGLFFLRLIYQVLKSLRLKGTALAAMQEDRRMFYEGRIWRFKAVLVFTILVIVSTVTCFVLDQFNETSWKFIDDRKINDYIVVSSALHFGMFGMWGTYVIALLVLFAPSSLGSASKNQVQYRRSEQLLHAEDEPSGSKQPDDDGDEDEIHFRHPKGT